MEATKSTRAGQTWTRDSWSGAMGLARTVAKLGTKVRIYDGNEFVGDYVWQEGQLVKLDLG
jgi:hypothetical protein